uniref:TPM domain-containing protein n=2 Tax=Medicago truncatula TaxID=3880 RepID=I3SW00_MEDTR|nr:unknown [Medicago truncatula]
MTTLFPPNSLSPLLNLKSSPSLQPKSTSLISYKPIVSNLKKTQTLSLKPPTLPSCTTLLTHAQQGLAALAITLALNFSPLLLSGNAFASEFDVINERPPKEAYVVDDAGVLSRVTKSDLKRLLADLESRKNFHINFITLRKLTSKADAFEFADQILERWYPSVEEGNDKGVVVLVTSQKEGAVTGGPAFVQAVGENILDATVSENLPVLATDEKYNEAIYSTAKRLVAAIDGLPDPGGPSVKDDKRESNFKT